MPKLNKLQKNFKKQMKKYDKKGLLPDSYRAKTHTVSFRENDDSHSKTSNFAGGCLHGCGFVIGKIITYILLSVIVSIIITALLNAMSKSL